MIELAQLGSLSIEAKRELLKTLLSLRNDQGVFPLSPGQQALWLIYQLMPKSPAYNFLFAARLPTGVDESALAQAFRALLRRHPALRTRFFLQDGKPVQKVEETLAIDIPTLDASSWSDDELLARLRQRGDEPFDLEHGPAMRIEFYRRQGETLMLMVFHHIVADLWSMDLLIEELKQLYVAAKKGQPASLPDLPGNFLDYLRWQLTSMHGPRGQKAWAFWQKELQGELPILELPTDHPRPPIQSFRTVNHTWDLDPGVTARLRALTARLGTTLVPAILSAFRLLLHRYTRQDDVLIGVTTADRGRPEWERLVGYFLNSVVLRSRLSEEWTLEELIQNTREGMYRILEHQDFPFPELVKRLAPVRDPSRSAVFQTMFIWDRPRELPFPRNVDLSRPPSPSDALTLESLLLEQRGDSFDLTLIIFEGEQLTARFSYNADLFNRSTIERMAGCLDQLLAQLASEAEKVLSEVSLLDASQTRKIVEEWSQPIPLDYPRIGFVELFESHAARTPDAIALIHEDFQLSYGELNARANRLARLLKERGVGPGDIVAIHTPRCMDMIVAVFAAWKARAAWLFLDPAYPAQRLTDMIADARPALVMTTTIESPDPSVPVLRLSADPRELERFSADNLDPHPGPDDWAYIIYTSGSTGRPKGTVLPHRGLVYLSYGMGEPMGFQAGDRFLQFSSMSFDASMAELTMALGRGGALVLGTSATLLPGPGLLALLRDKRVNAAILPPSILAALPYEPLPDLRSLCVAGEACPAELVQRWAPGRRFIDAYGPTEATVCATLATITPDDVAQGMPPTIGRAMGRTRIYVCDANLQPVPVGVPGELFLAGPGLALGYLNQPGLTAEKFIPCPFSREDGATLYRTGDLVRWRADGNLEFIGRIDHQVKIRGHRIEPDEVQEVLRQHPAVADAAVIVRKDKRSGPALAAYVVLRPGEQLQPIQEHLRRTLPHYMLPTSMQALEQMPLTVNGKIDRQALARLAPQSPSALHHVAPKTALEKKLAKVWAEVLSLESVGIHDNFFDLGGTSLQTVEVVALCEQLGLTLSPDLVFRHQTIAELAATIEEQQPSEEVPPVSEATIPAAALNGKGHAKTAACGALIESLGAYLPPRSLSTEDVLRGCQVPLDFPLERFTGIRSRRIAGEGEYSIDLARKALAECLARSKYAAADIDLLICCNISRYDGPFFRFSLEPTTAARLKKEFGLSKAWTFDVTNACAGTFTAIAVADTLLRQGAVRNALVVSGEYITHLTRTAQLEIENFTDPRMACLTLGDAGMALLLERSPDPKVGFHDLELYTLGKYHPLCIAKLTQAAHGGAIMYTDPVKSSVVTTRQAVQHALEVMQRNHWPADSLNHLIMHQTSERTLDGAMQEINRVLGKTVVHRDNTIYNLAERGNCATNTHFLAVWENIHAGKIRPGDRVVFAISGSGLNVGSALYTFDDLPHRLVGQTALLAREEKKTSKAACPTECLRTFRLDKPVRIESVSRPAAPGTSPDMLKAAGEDCLAQSAQPREQIDLMIHTGIYHTEFLSEPAMATIAAGELGINHDEAQGPSRRTFAFDLLNGATSTLSACYLAGAMIQSGKFSRAMILASEVENNQLVWPENLIGIRQTATAFILEPSSGSTGFVAFGFRGFAEHVEKRVTWTGAHDFRPAAHQYSDPQLDDIYLECIRVTVTEFLHEHKLTWQDIATVLPPWRSPEFVTKMAERLGVPAEKVVRLDDRAGDLFTSSLACVFAKARADGRLDGLTLAIEVGAGVQVACALYRGCGGREE